jgi:HD-GYP domain-containing protein (c-di-GMP phosphodiesterase class II)
MEVMRDEGRPGGIAMSALGRQVGKRGLQTDERTTELALASEVLRQEVSRRRVAQDRLVIAYDDLAQAYEETIRGWALALELRDLETRGHTRRVTAAMARLAVAMGVDAERLVHIRRGAILHDIGKLGIPDAVLLKRDRLTTEERALMERHPGMAVQMLSEIPFLRPALPIPHCHHERWDGGGYPQGLRRDDIPWEARMFSVVDVWDAVRSPRCYKEPWPADRVRDYLRESAGRQFDPTVVEAFLDLDVGASAEDEEILR